jgi:hypothetical protein
MFLLKTLPLVIKDPKLATVMADWVEDFRSDKPEAYAYIRWLRNWKKITITLLADTVAKFGDKKERHLIRKVVNDSFLVGRGRRKQRGYMILPMNHCLKQLLDKLTKQLESQ